MLRAVRSALSARQRPHLSEVCRGVSWRPPRGVGHVEDKIVTGDKYRVAVVIENSPTYVSEKLFDALRSGCVPIYVGPDLADFGIPSGVTIQEMPIARAILGQIRNAPTNALQAYQTRGQEFLASAQCLAAWDEASVAKRLATIIVKRVMPLCAT
jgi:hypothetical protein